MPKLFIYEILRILFSNMDFNFTYFVNFTFIHFEIKGSFGLMWVKLRKRSISLANPHLGI